ncbi:N-6 DNA methylase [Campylobacter helveticus]|nr:N-6 DNA methylase [Campylobacter helveticus]
MEKFPSEFKSTETADLFMALITKRLSHKGQDAVVLPDGFLFGTDNAKINLKKESS